MNSKVIAINGCHDASVTFVDKNNQVRIFEYERFCKKRFGIFKKDADNNILGTNDTIRNEFIDYIKLNLKEEPDTLVYSELNNEDISFLKTKFKQLNNVYLMGHHMSHCGGAYFQSGFKNALAISLDAGGYEYFSESNLGIVSYNVCKFINGKGQKIVDTNTPDAFVFNPGIYGSFGYYISEINKEINEVGKSDKNALTYAGKVMGLSAYGKVREEWVNAIEKFYLNHPLYQADHYRELEEQMSKEMNVLLYENCFSGQDSYDLAATNQYVFEKLCFCFVREFVDEYNLDVVLTGGCALNVIFNQKIKEYLNMKGLNLYVPPYPNDCGLSFGHFVSYQNIHIDPTPYCGIDIIDRDKLSFYYKKYNDNVIYYSPSTVVDLIKSGKIGGIIQGYSEVGPRALGNRSIICDPSIPEMKDIINSKVKFREWFRPFAPVCREEDKDLYFQNVFNSEYMSYAPFVKPEYRTVFPSITHEDGTARLQTVNRNQHSMFYDILTDLKTRDYPAVIMNTSFNIKGKPILTSLEDAFYVLENTELDFIVVENLIFLSF